MGEKDNTKNGPIRVYTMREDMRKYELDLKDFCGDQEKVMGLAMRIENMVASEGLTCEEALMIPAVLYMRMEMTTREQLNIRKYTTNITSET